MKNTQANMKKNLTELSDSRKILVKNPSFKIMKKLSGISIIRKIGTEFLGAFLGVLIALFVSNWHENNKQNEFIGSVIQSIYLNNEANNMSVKIQNAHLKMQQDTAKLYLKDEQLPLINLLGKNKGLHTQTLNFTGWNVLGRSKLISKVDYELISALMHNNEQYDVFRQKLELLMGILYEKPSSTLKEDKIRLLLGFDDLMGSSEIMEAETVRIDSLIKAKYPKLIADLIKEKRGL